jgi:hypothetical protein
MTRADQPLPGSGRPAAESSLNESQKRALLFGVLALHRRMADLEAILVQALEPSPFSAYANDLSPTEARGVRDYFGRLRATMLACLQEAGIPPEVRRRSARWALQTGVTFLHIGVAEMGPEKLRGYGPVGEAGRAQALKAQQDR